VVDLELRRPLELLAGRDGSTAGTWLAVHVMRKHWQIQAAKINGAEANPPRWPDGSYSVQGAAAVLGVTPQTVFDCLNNGRLQGPQLTKGQPWQITLPDDQLCILRMPGSTHHPFQEGGTEKVSSSRRPGSIRRT
jgi:hypothetical protein